jgi:glycosyltransferase involved in cell wall biosynthesis
MENKYVILLPCYNEGQVIISFLRQLEAVLGHLTKTFTVIVVDDCSSDETLSLLQKFEFSNIAMFELQVISLAYNMGHQGAINHGLKFASGIKANGYIVMDSDGEDNPEAILTLVKQQNFDIIFITRGKRKESLKFKVGYYFYQILFKLICGRKINFGNYTMLSPRVLQSVSLQTFFHYSAFLSKLRFHKQEIQFDREKRIDGKSKMNYNNLVFHGLKSLIEYSEELLFSLIKVFLVIILALFGYSLIILYKKFISKEAVTGWTSTLGTNLFNSLLIILGTILISLLILSMKNNLNNNNKLKQIR